jgi:hypothetical protein
MLRTFPFPLLGEALSPVAGWPGGSGPHLRRESARRCHAGYLVVRQRARRSSGSSRPGASISSSTRALFMLARLRWQVAAEDHQVRDRSVTKGEVSFASIINLIFENHQDHGDAISPSRPSGLMLPGRDERERAQRAYQEWPGVHHCPGFHPPKEKGI